MYCTTQHRKGASGPPIAIVSSVSRLYRVKTACGKKRTCSLAQRRPAFGHGTAVPKGGVTSKQENHARSPKQHRCRRTLAARQRTYGDFFATFFGSGREGERGVKGASCFVSHRASTYCSCDGRSYKSRLRGNKVRASGHILHTGFITQISISQKSPSFECVLLIFQKCKSSTF